jgi:hypothetical protein
MRWPGGSRSDDIVQIPGAKRSRVEENTATDGAA